MNFEEQQANERHLSILWKLLQNFFDTFNTLTTGLDIRATSQHLHTSISPDKITMFTVLLPSRPKLTRLAAKT